MQSQVIPSAYTRDGSWADFNLCDYASMSALCNAAAWKLPCRVCSQSRELMAEFLAVMDDEHNMQREDFWTLRVGTPETGWVDYSSTPTRASIDMDRKSIDR